MRINAIIVLTMCISAAAFAEEDARSIKVFIVAHGWHAGVVIPAADVEAIIPELKERFPGTNQYEIGWGDQDYYQADAAGIRLAIRALFASRGSVLHVVAMSEPVPTAPVDGGSAETCLTKTQYLKLVAFIAETFDRDARGKVVPKSSGRYGNSQFYQARGRFSMNRTCNRWAADAFGAAGIKVSSAVLTSRGLMGAVRSNSKACTVDQAPNHSLKADGPDGPQP